MGGKRNTRWEAINKLGIPLEKAIADFITALRAEHLSPQTVAWYQNLLQAFNRWLLQEDRSMVLRDLGKQEAREFLVYLQGRRAFDQHPYVPTAERPLSSSTLHAHARAMRRLGSWLAAEGYTRDDIFRELRLPKLDKDLVDCLNQEEIRKVMGVLSDRTATGCRDMALFLTLLDSGLRCAEVCSLTALNAHLEEGYLLVKGKGNKERVVPIGLEVRRLLSRYVSFFRPHDSPCDRLLLSVDGGPLSTNAVRLMLTRLGRKAGVPRLHAHLLRHTMAVHYLMNGGDQFTLQDILGHSDLTMTRRYVRFASHFVRIQHSRFSPVDRLGLYRAVRPAKRGRPRRPPLCNLPARPEQARGPARANVRGLADRAQKVTYGASRTSGRLQRVK